VGRVSEQWWSAPDEEGKGGVPMGYWLISDAGDYVVKHGTWVDVTLERHGTQVPMAYDDMDADQRWKGWPPIQQVGRYEYGVRVGDWRSYWPEGKVESEGRYSNGQKEGVWWYYERNGQFGGIGEWRAGAICGLQVHRFGASTGDVADMWSFAEYEDGRPHGKAITVYLPTGMAMSEKNYSHGSPHGVWRTWDKEGNLLSEELVKD
jgi:hypothetical protein